MDPANAIELKNIKKSFKIEISDPEKKGGLFNKTPVKIIENGVLDGISLNIKKGEVLGVVGRNGSGKSTLLSIIARIMEPDSGTVECSGNVASILELGMGFHPDMSGRENIYLKGELYGFSRKEMDSKIDKIIEYSGISRYIDNPVRTYSSGMSGRLAFSIMVNVDSEIMLVDEILSTGDASFSAKAGEHFKKMAKSGKTIVFVSHSLGVMTEMCTRAVWIEGGKIIKDGSAKSVCAEYQNKMASSPDVIADLAEAGVAESQYNLALLYRDGTHFGKSEELYREWVKRAAEQGHTLAQVAYADVLIADGGDISEAMNFYQSAANKGNNDARLRLASLRRGQTDSVFAKLKEVYLKMAEEGEPINQFRCGDYLLKTAFADGDRKLAFRWFNESANQGFTNALYQVAVMHRDGIGTERSIPKAEEYFLKAAGKGHMPSILFLADAYFQGRVLPKNDGEAFKLYLKGAKLGNGRCQFQAAVMYESGIGTEIDLEESVRWFDAFSKSPIAFNAIWAADWAKLHGEYSAEDLGEMYKTALYAGLAGAATSIINLPVDPADAISALESLVSNGNSDAKRRLANMHYSGTKTKKDYAKALGIYEELSEEGDVLSMNHVAEMYRDGKGVSVDIGRSAEYYYKSVCLGNFYAILNLFDLYNAGVIEKDVRYDDCMKLMDRLADTGNIDAIKYLANSYYGGNHFKRNYTLAYGWYEKGAILGDQMCKNRLVEMCRDGKGTEADTGKAFGWFVNLK